MPAKTSNTKDIKKANRNILYREIHRHDGLSRPELAARLKMSFPTLIQYIKSLLDNRLIHESGCLESTGGRKAATLSIVKDARIAVGVDISQYRFSAAIVGLDGSVILEKVRNVPFSPRKSYIASLGRFVDRLIDAAGVDRAAIIGAGLAFPGIVSADNASGDSHILNVTDYPFAPLREVLNLPTRVINDANAAAVAEAWVSGGEKKFIYLSLRDAVGGAMVWNGKPLSGDNGRCGEFGHMTVERGGLRCYCGKKGCLDAYCSSLILAEKAGGDFDGFFRQLDAGDSRLALFWNDYLDYLATGVNILRMAFDYDVVLGGSVGAHMDNHLEALRKRVAQLDTFDTTASYIKVCRQRGNATAIGAALVHVERFIASI